MNSSSCAFFLPLKKLENVTFCEIFHYAFCLKNPLSKQKKPPKQIPDT